MWPLSLVLLMAAAVATGPVETVLFQTFNSSVAPEQLHPPRLFNSSNSAFSLKENSSATRGKPTSLRGAPVTPGEKPWHVSLMVRVGAQLAHACSGALISPSAVLTIATCFYDSRNGQLFRPESELRTIIKVVSGTTNLSPFDGSTQQKDLSKIIKLDKFGTTGQIPQYNLAIVKVSEPFKVDSFTKPISWAADKIVPGTACSVSGWGFTPQTLIHPDLRASDERMADTEICKSYFEGMLGPVGTIIDLRCTKRDTSFLCEDEFGGPVVCGGKLAGIAFGLGCSNVFAPFTATDFHHDWIKENAAATTSVPIGVFVSAFLLIVFQQAAL